MPILTRTHAHRTLIVLLVLALVASLGGGVDRAEAREASGHDQYTMFRDVAPASTHAVAIDAMARAGIALGCGAERYCPADVLTRAQMATLLVKAFDLPAGTGGGFKDVPASSVHRENIDALAAGGITGGCRDDRFCPEQPVTRAQFASFLARMLDLAPSGRHQGFADAKNSPHADAILAIVDAGIAAGCSATSFCGGDAITRGQFATLIYQAASADTAAWSARLAERPPPTKSTSADAGGHLLFSAGDVAGFRASMSGDGAFFTSGDAGHGGRYSPGDGKRSEQLAKDFLSNPSASYWTHPNLPFSAGDTPPTNSALVRPMHAAWIHMTQPEHPDHDRLGNELKKLLLTQAEHPSLDYSNANNYPNDYHGAAPSPIFDTAHWFTRQVKTRDMLGRDLFTATENAKLDQWFHGYANWSANWLHVEAIGDKLPGRLDRDYSTVSSSWSTADAASYDGGPKISKGARAYTNRHAAIASAMSAAANYLAHHDHDSTTKSKPSYGVYTVNELLEHSRLFVEETLRFSVYPQGFQGDFERGDQSRHSGASAQQGWLYSINVLANLTEIADYHAGRGDMSVWNYGTTAGLAGSQGTPIAGGFKTKNLHFYAWAMSRYVNDGWGRTNRGEPLVRDNFYHDVIPAAMAHRHAPNDTLLEAAWKRQGQGFSDYPQSPQSQGPHHAHQGEGGKMIGLIEHIS